MVVKGWLGPDTTSLKIKKGFYRKKGIPKILANFNFNK